MKMQSIIMATMALFSGATFANAGDHPSGNWTYSVDRNISARVIKTNSTRILLQLDKERLDDGWHLVLPTDINIDATKESMEVYYTEDDSSVFSWNGFSSNVVSKTKVDQMIPGYNCRYVVHLNYQFFFPSQTHSIANTTITERFISTNNLTNNCENFLAAAWADPSLLLLGRKEHSPTRNILDSNQVSREDFVKIAAASLSYKLLGVLYSRQADLLDRCGTAEAMLTHSPVDEAALQAISPMGVWSESNNILSPNLKFQLNQGSSLSPLRAYAPGKIRVYAIERFQEGTRVGYNVRFRGCREMKARFEGLQQLSAALAQAMTSTHDNECSSYSANSSYCHYYVKLDLPAGTEVGIIGTSVANFNIRSTDTRTVSNLVHPKLYTDELAQASCFLNYFQDSLKAFLEERLGISFVGGFVKTGCGKVDHDSKYNAQGNWFRADNLRLASDNLMLSTHILNSNLLEIGLGERMPLAPGSYLFDRKALDASLVNVPFFLIKVGKIGCYENARTIAVVHNQKQYVSIEKRVFLVKRLAKHKLQMAIIEGDNCAAVTDRAGAMNGKSILFQR